MVALIRLGASLALVYAFNSAAAATPRGDARTAEAVKAATQAYYHALNEGNATEVNRYLLPGGDSFPRNGKELGPEVMDAERSIENLRKLFASGLRFDVRIRDLNVKIYGGTAIATFYLEGSSTVPGTRTAETGSYRASYVWLKRDDGWKIAHFHLSRFTP